MMNQLSGRDRRWLSALLVLGTLTVALIFIDQVAGYLTYFSDIILTIFLAWLLAFVLSPIPDLTHRWAPRLPRMIVIAVTYGVLLVGILLITIITAQALVTSISSFVNNLPQLIDRLPELLAPWQAVLDGSGLSVDLQATAQSILAEAGTLGGTAIQPLTDVALASIGVLGNLVLILILSLYIVADRDRMLEFSQRLVPERYVEEYRLLRISVARSFGGFLRGQGVLGIIYFLVALVAQIVLGLPYTAASASLAGALMAIPFFGPFIAWMPPVIVAALEAPDKLLPTLAIMLVGLLLELNIVQPRVMSNTVGISPLIVLGSVIVGIKIAGIPGAVFSVPIAAVISSFFWFYLDRYRPLPTAEPEPTAVADAEATATGPPEGATADPPSG